MARRKIKSELKKILQSVPENKKAIASRIAEELIFLNETLTELKAQIKENGTIELFEQGAQKFYRESPALKSYNVTINRYSQLYKQLTDLLPKETEAHNAGELYEFLKGD